MNLVKEKKWYTVKVQNNYERKVSERLKIEMGRKSSEVNVMIPSEIVFYLKEGKKASKEKILYPGYIFVETDHVGYLDQIVKATTGATNILRGPDKSPVPLKQSEVDKMLGVTATKRIIDGFNFITGEEVQITFGVFENFVGKIESVDNEKSKLKVAIPIFGKTTSVDVPFDEVKRV
jgi:transcription termination/antitermination protein NusG